MCACEDVKAKTQTYTHTQIASGALHTTTSTSNKDESIVRKFPETHNAFLHVPQLSFPLFHDLLATKLKCIY